MANRYHAGPPTDHFDGQRFFNPGQADTDRSLADIWRWKRGTTPAAWPRTVPIVPVVPAPRVEGLRVTMVGHATLLVQLAGLNILTDPVWSARASPVAFAGPRRVTEPGIAFDALPPIDLVLVSHNHYDHLDLATLARIDAAHGAVVVTPLGNDGLIGGAMPRARIVTLDWDGSTTVADTTVHVTPANHWSARALGDRRMALWGGFIIEAGGRRVYFAGDTGYGDGAIFRAMRERYGAPDVALLPIGAYAPRWFMAPQHVDPQEAVAIMDDLGARHALGIHWGAFQLTDEARDEPAERLRAALDARGIDHARFRAAGSGEVFDYDAAL